MTNYPFNNCGALIFGSKKPQNKTDVFKDLHLQYETMSLELRATGRVKSENTERQANSFLVLIFSWNSLTTTLE